MQSLHTGLGQWVGGPSTLHVPGMGGGVGGGLVVQEVSSLWTKADLRPGL